MVFTSNHRSNVGVFNSWELKTPPIGLYFAVTGCNNNATGTIGLPATCSMHDGILCTRAVLIHNVGGEKMSNPFWNCLLQETYKLYGNGSTESTWIVLDSNFPWGRSVLTQRLGGGDESDYLLYAYSAQKIISVLHLRLCKFCDGDFFCQSRLFLREHLSCKALFFSKRGGCWTFFILIHFLK